MSLHQFSRRLVSSGLVTADEIDDVFRSRPTAPPRDVEGLARALVRRKKLTAYQARKIYRGESVRLILGNYVILDRIGRGGMGIVYKAQHRRMGHIVALKMLAPEVMNSKAALPRFQREVRAAGRLNHRNIVNAYDADQIDNIHFLILEYVRGTDLGKLVRERGPMPVDQAIHCIHQAALGLAYAHEQGLIHRDIKPSNILLGTDGVVKILDMGLARLDEPRESQFQLTRVGQILGTVDFMAPEQAIDNRKTDPRVDIYSLGVTLWYLLVGRTMYEGESSIERLLAHREQPIPSLSAACPSASLAVEAIFTKMVAKDPKDRYANMRQLIVDLDRLIAPEPSNMREVMDTSAEEDARLNDFFRSMEAANLDGPRPQREAGTATLIAPAPAPARSSTTSAPSQKKTAAHLSATFDTDPVFTPTLTPLTTQISAAQPSRRTRSGQRRKRQTDTVYIVIGLLLSFLLGGIAAAISLL